MDDPPWEVHRRGRGKVLGTPQRPRMCVFKSLKHMYVQLVDDSAHHTLVTVSTLKLEGKKLPNGGNVAAARDIGKEIAAKARDLGIETVALHSEADEDSLHVKFAHETVCIGPPASTASYLNIPAIISAAEVTDASAIHPGYGFLAERADFSQACQDNGLR